MYWRELGECIGGCLKGVFRGCAGVCPAGVLEGSVGEGVTNLRIVVRACLEGVFRGCV